MRRERYSAEPLPDRAHGAVGYIAERDVLWSIEEPLQELDAGHPSALGRDRHLRGHSNTKLLSSQAHAAREHSNEASDPTGSVLINE